MRLRCAARKTSLLNIIGTIDKPTKGEITICGQRITSTTTDRQFADLRLRRIGFVFQTFNLIPSMNAEENVALPMILAGDKSRQSIARRAKELPTGPSCCCWTSPRATWTPSTAPSYSACCCSSTGTRASPASW